MGPEDSVFGSVCLCIYLAKGRRHKKRFFSVIFVREERKDGESHLYFLGDCKGRKRKANPQFLDSITFETKTNE